MEHTYILASAATFKEELHWINQDQVSNVRNLTQSPDSLAMEILLEDLKH